MLFQGLSALLFGLSLLLQQQSAAPTARSAPESFQIAGIVIDALNSQPLSGVQVFIEGQALVDSGQAITTGENGRFAFDNLAPGHYRLSARRKGYIQQAYKQHEFFSTAIIVGPGLDTSGLRFALSPEASISGQIVDEMNDPVRHAQVMLFQRGSQLGRPSTWQRARSSTDDQGHYRFAHLSPGTYLIAASAQPWYAQHEVNVVRTGSAHGEVLRDEEVVPSDPALDVVYPVTFFSNATEISGAVPLILHLGDSETADISLRPIPALRVTINYVPSGKPDEPENVWPRASLPLMEGVEVSLQSVRSNQIRPGLLEITGLLPGALNLSLHSSRGSETATRSLALNLSADTSLNMSESASSATISGVVKLEDGSRVSGIHEVQFHNRPAGQQFSAQVQDTGEFTLRQAQSLPPGTYDVAVSGSSPLGVRSLSATGAKVSGRTLEVAAGQDVKLTILASKGTGRITGVALKDDKPIDGVMVVLVPEDPEHNLVLFRRDQSDSDGSFNLVGILPGKYAVIAIENGWALDWNAPGVLQKYLAAGEPVQVAPNAKIELKIKVQYGDRSNFGPNSKG